MKLTHIKKIYKNKFFHNNFLFITYNGGIKLCNNGDNIHTMIKGIAKVKEVTCFFFRPDPSRLTSSSPSPLMYFFSLRLPQN